MTMMVTKSSISKKALSFASVGLLWLFLLSSLLFAGTTLAQEEETADTGGLTDGEAEWYRGIKVTYVAGREAILTIKKEGVEQEKVIMHTLKDKAAMHEMMISKGFVRKSETEINQITADAKADKLKEHDVKAIKMKERREAAALKYKQHQQAEALSAGTKNDVRKGTNLNDIQQSEEILRMALSSGSSSSSSSMMFIPLIAGVLGISVVTLMWRQNKRRRSALPLTGQIRLSI